jgi:hypothetical protein
MNHDHKGRNLHPPLLVNKKSNAIIKGSSKIMSTKESKEKTSSMSVKPNYSSIFPSAKIKALLHQEEKIGGVRSSAVSMAGE